MNTPRFNQNNIFSLIIVYLLYSHFQRDRINLQQLHIVPRTKSEST